MSRPQTTVCEKARSKGKPAMARVPSTVVRRLSGRSGRANSHPAPTAFPVRAPRRATSTYRSRTTGQRHHHQPHRRANRNAASACGRIDIEVAIDRKMARLISTPGTPAISTLAGPYELSDFYFRRKSILRFMIACFCFTFCESICHLIAILA